MSTQAVITFKDEHEEFHVFRHWDGYPSAVIPDLDELFRSNNVWELPRFEASEASAGMIAAFKKQPGGYRITNASMGKDYGYLVEVRDGVVRVTVAGYGEFPTSGTLPEMLVWAKDRH